MSIRDVLGDRLADELLRELESLRGELKRVIGEEIRPWAEFFGPISLPDWASGEAKKRIQVNASFFRANYTVFCMALWGLFLIFQPVFLVVLLGCGLLYFAVYLTRKQPLLLGDLSLGITGRLAVVSVMVFLLLAVTGYIFRLQWPISLGAVVCAGHAIFRPPVARALAAMNGKVIPRAATLLRLSSLPLPLTCKLYMCTEKHRCHRFGGGPRE
jgi:hypothetical protein